MLAPASGCPPRQRWQHSMPQLPAKQCAGHALFTNDCSAQPATCLVAHAQLSGASCTLCVADQVASPQVLPHVWAAAQQLVQDQGGQLWSAQDSTRRRKAAQEGDDSACGCGLDIGRQTSAPCAAAAPQPLAGVRPCNSRVLEPHSAAWPVPGCGQPAAGAFTTCALSCTQVSSRKAHQQGGKPCIATVSYACNTACTSYNLPWSPPTFCSTNTMAAQSLPCPACCCLVARCCATFLILGLSRGGMVLGHRQGAGSCGQICR